MLCILGTLKMVQNVKEATTYNFAEMSSPARFLNEPRLQMSLLPACLVTYFHRHQGWGNKFSSHRFECGQTWRRFKSFSVNNDLNYGIFFHSKLSYCFRRLGILKNLTSQLMWATFMVLVIIFRARQPQFSFTSISVKRAAWTFC